RPPQGEPVARRSPYDVAAEAGPHAVVGDKRPLAGAVMRNLAILDNRILAQGHAKSAARRHRARRVNAATRHASAVRLVGDEDAFRCLGYEHAVREYQILYAGSTNADAVHVDVYPTDLNVSQYAGLR